MLCGESSSSSSSSSIASLGWKYDVFLSFRGQDTRQNFTDHLYAALLRKKIKTFRDDREVKKGDVISQELLKAIEGSLAAVVVLSEDYASSSWCLDELQKILESKREKRLEVFPIFYGVSPSDVRHQRNTFAEAFEKHALKFKEDKEKVQKWRDSMKEVAGIAGWESNNRLEAELIEEIVDKVQLKLYPEFPSYSKEVIGIDSRVKEIDALLSVGSQDVRFIGIWGMGGIGKTTIARVIYERIHSQFEFFCFLSNVREVSQAFDGLVQLQRKILSPLKISNLEIDDLYEGKKEIRKRLCNKRVLLILDDISGLNQLENLAPNKEWFGLGSRIIVTTRDEHLLISHGVHPKYKMKILNAKYSIQLFSQHAFKSNQPPKSYVEWCEIMVQYAGGLPLALKVLGSFLCGRSLCEWEEAWLYMINQHSPDDYVLNTLRISYDGLKNEEKELFLDIAFFFTRRKKENVIQMLKDCGTHATLGINLLIEKSLVNCHWDILEVHELLQEMVRNFVIQKSPSDASKRSRLCSLEDIDQVLRENKGTELIEGIILKSNKPYEAHWNPKAFSKMCNLRILIILCDLHLPQGLNCLSSSLKILEWKGYPLDNLPLNLPLDELIHLKMQCSKIKRLWKGRHYFRKLKSIDLSYSKDLIQTPDVSGLPCLERLVLKGCKNVVEVHQSISKHKNLAILNLKGCNNLKILPEKLEMDALKVLILSGCSNIKMLPEFGESMKSLGKLNLNGCISLVGVDPQNFLQLKKSLTNLKIDGCSKLLSENNALEEVDASETAIIEVISSVKSKKHLGKFPFRGWKGALKSLIHFEKYSHRKELKLELPILSGFSALTKLNLRNCNLADGSIPGDFGRLSSLEELMLSGNNFVNLPASITNLSRLIFLDLDDCQMLQTLPDLPPSLRWLFATNCNQMEPISFDIQNIWRFFMPHRWNMFNPFWFMVPGIETPPWFSNQEYFPMNPHATDYEYCEDYDLVTSMTVEIPDYCRSSEWWGVAVCLSLENNVKKERHDSHSYRTIQFRWASKTPDSDIDSPLSFRWLHNTHFVGHHLYITIFSSVHGITKPYRTSDQNKLQLLLHAVNHCECGKIKIWKCGSRVVCKEDAEAWPLGWGSSIATSEEQNSDLPRQSIRITEVTDESEDTDSTSYSDSTNPK